MTNPRERNNIDSVLQVSVSANFELYQEIRRDAVMCEAMKELMKDEIDEQINKAEYSAHIKDIKNIMESLKYTAEQAMDLLKIPQNERASYLAKL